MKYLGFRITRYFSFWKYEARRLGIKDSVSISCTSLTELKKYLRAIHAAERTGVIRRKRSLK